LQLSRALQKYTGQLDLSPLLVVPGLAAAQSRYFTYERGIDRPGHAYRWLETHKRG
jgi:hypothetical protein